MTLLILSLLVLLSGPLLYKLVQHEPRAFWSIDGFVLASIGGLILFHVLPPTLATAGGGALLALLAGLVLPILAEQIRGGHDHHSLIHKLSVGVALVGLVLHTLLDGITLAAQTHNEVSTALASAVLLHRFPVALLVWWLIRPTRGRRAAIFAIAMIAIATVTGFLVEEHLHQAMESVGFAYVQAFIAGSLLHVIAHHPPHQHDHSHDHDHDHHHDHASQSSCGCSSISEDILGEPVSCSSSQDDDHDHHEHHHHDDEHHGHNHDHHHDHETSHPMGEIAHDHAMIGGHHHADGHHHDHDHHSHPHPLMSGIGAIAGIGLVVALPFIETLVLSQHSGAHADDGHHHHHAHDVVVEDSLFVFTGYGERFWDLFVESAPALLFGYILAGLFASFLPRASMTWMNRGSHPQKALRGMAFGLPIPICSCGVVPLYQSLIRKGVPASAALAFMIATPELGIEALLLSLPLLGTELTIARLVAAALVALLAGWVIGRIIPTIDTSQDVEIKNKNKPLKERLKEAADFGLREVLDETGPWIIVGLSIAALLAQGNLTNSLLNIPSVVQVMLFALISLPLYVCASGATPLAAGLIFAGASPGSALAFLLAGPATNVTTFGVLSNMHGKRIAILFGLVVIGLSVMMGLGVDLIFQNTSLHVQVEDHLHDEHSLVQLASAWALVALFFISLLRTGPRHWMQTVLSFGGGHSH